MDRQNHFFQENNPDSVFYVVVSLLPVERRLDPMGRELESPPRFRVVDFKK
jgi:hypothetical protein